MATMQANISTNLTTVPSEILLASVAFKFSAMIIGVLGNITVIIHTIFKNKEKTPTSYLVANLALADLLVCSTFYPIWITEFIRTILNIDSDQDLFCKLSRSTIWALLFVSVATLLAITVDRYLFIVKPLLYPQIVTHQKVFIAISGIWLTSCPLFGVLYAHWMKCPSRLRSVCFISIFDHFFTLVNVVVACVPLIGIFALNFYIFIVAQKQRKRILAETTLNAGILKEESSRKLIRFFVGLKTAKTFFIVVAVLAVCMITPTVVGLTLDLSCDNIKRQIWLVVAQYEFYGINSIVNAFIYGMMHIKYRKAYGQILYEVFLCRKFKDYSNSPLKV